jgi:hypothetical protein
MTVSRYRQNVDISLGELNQSARVIAQPQIILLVPPSLTGRSAKHQGIEFFLGCGDHRLTGNGHHPALSNVDVIACL